MLASYSRQTDTRAYTLPELLITLLLMGILFVLAFTFTASTGQARRLRDYSYAVALAQHAIELCRAAPYRLLDEADSGVKSMEYNLNRVDNINDPFGGKFESNGIFYRRIIEISDVMSAQFPDKPAGVKQLRVTVEWQTNDGPDPDPIVISTLVPDLN